VVLYQDLPVFADVYKLTLRIFAVTQDFCAGVQVHSGL
jgi:hypothetical protein